MHLTRRAFTLIELLVVIAIIAILSVVVILTLNPAELLRQSRDSNRVSDMSMITEALNVYNTDQSAASTFSLGSSSVVYVSIPDPNATTTAGTNCSLLGLPTLPSTYSYHCAASSTLRLTNGTGWIPVNFSAISSGSPLGNEPIDPVNASSSRNYYTYTTNGTQFELTAPMESAKYGVGGSGDVITPDGANLATVYAKGTNLALEPLDYGDSSLLGYWPLNEGTGTIAYDDSGTGLNATWYGTAAGTNGYYSTGKIEPWAGYFNGSNNNHALGVTSTITTFGDFTLTSWVYCSGSAQESLGMYENSSTGASGQLNLGFPSPGLPYGSTYNGATSYNAYGSGNACNSTWQFEAFTRKGSLLTIYSNGTANGTTTDTGFTVAGNQIVIGDNGGSATPLTGYLNNIRFYTRALTAAQIAAMYSGGK